MEKITQEDRRIGEILGRMRANGMFKGIGRCEATLDLDFSLKVVEAIGRERISGFLIDDANRFVYENLIKWCHADKSMECIDPESKEKMPADLSKGVYIAGNTGTGKSWALEIMTAYSHIANLQVVTGGNKRCLYWGNVRSDAICDEFTSSGSVERYKKMAVLGIQDLGAEPSESVWMGNRINVMKQILEYRGDRQDLITLITSNLPFRHKRFLERYDDRVVSRLNAMCNYFELTGKDRRI